MKTINVELNVDNKEAVKSVNSLEQELEQLREEFSKVEIGSKEFNRLGSAIKKTEGQIKDIELQFESLDKEQRIVAVTDSFAGLAGTVEIAVGAFAALGIESEELENVERRVIGLIGVVQGFQAVGEGIIAFNKIIGTGLTDAFRTATGSINGFRVALASIGLGLVITAVTTLINKWDDWFPKAKTLNEELGLTEEALDSLSAEAAKQTTEVNLLVRAVTDQTRSEKERREALEELNKKYPKYFEDLGNDINDTEALTKQKNKLIDTLIREARVRAAQEEIQKIAAANIGQRIKLSEDLQKATENTAKANRELDKTTEGLVTTQKDFTVDFDAYNRLLAKNPGLQEKIQKASANRIGALNKEADVRAKINQLNKEEEEATKALTDLIDTETAAIQANGGASNASAKATGESTKATEENVKAVEAQGKALGQTTSAEEQYTANFVNLSNIRIEATKMEESVRQAIREQRRKERQEEFKEDAEAFQGQVDAYADYANRVASNIREFQEQNTEVQQNLLKNQFDQGLITEEQYLKQSEELQKKAFEQNKNVSIAQAIISTIQGGVDAFTSTLKIDPTGITGTILAGLALAAGYAQVDAIRSTTYESPNEGPSSIGGGGSARVGIPLSTGGGAPGGLFSDRITLGQDSATTGAGGTTKMYVLAGDVTSAQAANAKIKQRRKL